VTDEVGVGEANRQNGGEVRAGVDKLEEVFGHGGGYPTSCQPFQSCRDIENISSMIIINKLYKQSKIQRGSHADGILRAEAKQIVYTWQDLFISEVKEMPISDLVCHYILTSPDSIPVRAREKLFTHEESLWLEQKIPEMLSAGIIEHVVSPC